MNIADLIAFENEVGRRFEAKEIRGPVHLSGGNEFLLIDIFKDIPRDAWVLSTWRNHYHALLHGIPRDKVMGEILAGRSMTMHFPEYRFMTSAIVGGLLPIACGLAAAGHKVFCFVGDMCHSTGAFRDAMKYARGHNLPVRFIIEDNGLSTNTPTLETWGRNNEMRYMHYHYTRTVQHCGTDIYVSF